MVKIPKKKSGTKIIQGMKIYNSEQVKKSLEGAGFTEHKNTQK
mgnify:CR=1 FL=1